jgi:hypothetical protein
VEGLSFLRAMVVPFTQRPSAGSLRVGGVSV